MNPEDCFGKSLAAARTLAASSCGAAIGTPPSEAITFPCGSVTRNMALSCEIRDQSSVAVSRMVASSPVPKAARTSDMPLRIKLTEDNWCARACHRDWYAWKLVCTSSSRLWEVVSIALLSTIHPVTASSTVIATEVESRVFHCSDRRENRNLLISHPSSTTGRR